MNKEHGISNDEVKYRHSTSVFIISCSIFDI
jgi:hypothetical protein